MVRVGLVTRRLWVLVRQGLLVAGVCVCVCVCVFVCVCAIGY